MLPGKKGMKAKTIFLCLQDRQHSQQDSVGDRLKKSWLDNTRHKTSQYSPKQIYMIFFHILLIILHTLMLCSL